MHIDLFLFLEVFSTAAIYLLLEHLTVQLYKVYISDIKFCIIWHFLITF